MAELPYILTELSYDGKMINTKIVHTLRQVIKPVDMALNGSTVSFNIPNNVGESYLNLKETNILLTCSIQKADGTKMKSTDKRVLPSNNFLACLFDNVQVMVNNTIVSTQDMRYHMKAYSNMVHNWTSSFAETEFENTGFLFEDGMQSFAGAVPKRKFKLNLDKRKIQPTNSSPFLWILLVMVRSTLFWLRSMRCHSTPNSICLVTCK